jgi:uncharacterized membrane protein
VFGFALTLLVVSLEVPADFSELRGILVGFPAFAVTFIAICWVWYEHYLFFRRYGLEDGFTVVLNCGLLFIVVFYAYPLKFIATRLITGSIMGLGPGIGTGMSSGDARVLMLVYSGGFVALFATFMLLHGNVLRQRARLHLDALALYDARASVQRHAISVAIGVLSMVIAAALPIQFMSFAGLIFFAMGPAHGVFGYYNGRRRETLEASLCPPSGMPQPEPTSAGGSTA